MKNKKKLLYTSVILLFILLAGVISFNFKCSQNNGIILSESKKDNHNTYTDSKYIRPLINTYLTYPEWYIVYSSEEYAETLMVNNPSQFKYFGAIKQFWQSYCEIKKSTHTNLNPNPDYDIMLWVIGVSYSLENLVKGIYENSIGRITETLGGAKTDEDLYIANSNMRYVDHIYQVPFYEFNYFQELKNFWTEVPILGFDLIRKLERRIFFHNELFFKGIYGSLIKFQIYLTDSKDETQIQALVRNFNSDLGIDPVQLITNIDENLDLVYLPRYQELTEFITQIVNEGITFEDISGNQEIFLTLTSTLTDDLMFDYQKLIELEFLMNPTKSRVGISVPVTQLHTVLLEISENLNLELEHVYDY